MSNLSDFQKKLINELTNEFDKLNPKQKVDNGVKRFSVGTINNCINEEEKFKQTMVKHNLTMLKVFVGQLKDDIKSFQKEFGKVFDFQVGLPKGNGVAVKKTIEELETATKNAPLYISNYNEVQLFIISKKKYLEKSSTSTFDPCNGKLYTDCFVALKSVREKIVLESGKEVGFEKIVGLNYALYNHNYSSSNKQLFATLDGLIQGEKGMQQRMVNLTQ